MVIERPDFGMIVDHATATGFVHAIDPCLRAARR